MNKASTYLLIAALLGGLAVIIGAFGAHGLKKTLSVQALETYQTGVSYHFYHVMALIAVALWCKLTQASVWLDVSAYLFIAGILLFSGSLYLLAISGIRWLGAITPLGGVCFILGWCALAFSAVKEGSA